MRFHLAFAFGVVLWAGSADVAAQTPSQVAAVELDAVVGDAPASITLRWRAVAGSTDFTVSRRAPGGPWSAPLATLSGDAVEYTDTTVELGVPYEYEVVRNANAGAGRGYLRSGIDVWTHEDQGTLLLVVDASIAQPVAADIDILIADLNADGWQVKRIDVERTAPVADVKAAIVAAYMEDPTQIRALYLLGHVPVPYSGNINPDGHSEHHGAWPADAFYADMDGTWTDTSVNNSNGSRPETHNVPGDGKYDQSELPSAVEVALGRVDLSDMPAFGDTEEALLSRYLQKAHAFKTRQFNPMPRAIVFDNFQYLSYPLASPGLLASSAFVSRAEVTFPPPTSAPFYTYVDGESYLFTYACGGGWYTNANNVGTTSDYAASDFGGVFNQVLGSYFGDWDNTDNFLRAPLAGGSGLTSVWAGLPNWWFHGMAMGDTVGEWTRISHNNDGDYAPANSGWQGEALGRVHLALMGDPTLRLFNVAPPSDATAVQDGSQLTVSWTPSPQADVEYVIYRVDATGSHTRLTPDPVSGATVVLDVQADEVGSDLLVKAVYRQVSASGRYYNPSLGVRTTVTGEASGAGAGGGASVGAGGGQGQGGNNAGDDTDDAGGCACSVVAPRPTSLPPWLILGVVAILRRRSRRSAPLALQ